MGLFDKRSSLERFLEEHSTKLDYSISMSDISEYIAVFGEEKLIEVITRITEHVSYYKSDFTKHLHVLADVYKSLVIVPGSIELENAFKNLIELYFDDEEIVTKENIIKACNSFDNKVMVVEFFKFFINNENVLDGIAEENIAILVAYLEEARQYFVDDRALFSSFMTLVSSVDPTKLKYGKEKDLKRIVKKKLEEDKKANGIYDVDQATLKEMDRKIEQLGVLSERISTLIQTAEKQIDDLAESSNNHRTLLTEARVQELKLLSDEANAIIKNFNASYLELLGQQKQSILDERDLIIADIDRQLEQRRVGLNSYVDQIGQRVGIELRRIRNVSQESIGRIESFLSDNEEVKKLLGEAQNSGEFLKRLREVEAIAAKVGGSSQASVSIPPLTAPVSTGGALDGLVLPTFIIPQEDRVINPAPNYYFDKTIPFRDRFQQLMDLKQRMIEENGAIFHERFDDILTMILLNDAPYMYGPSGCGKTYMIQNQLAKLLNIDVVTNGYVLYEQDILGYTNSGTGGYVPSNFYRCYKFGDIIFFDELDNGIANATTVLNSFLTGSDTDKYVFPNGEQVGRHVNFRIVAAGNTKGSGKTLAHNTRQKMDESVMQRLTPVEIGYDNRIEEQILVDYPGWYDFAINFRRAIESIPSDSGEEKNTIGTFTTRDAQAVKKYKDNDAMTDEQLIDYEIIENKDIDYLNQIKKKLLSFEQSGGFTTEHGRQLLKTFRTKVEERSKR